MNPNLESVNTMKPRKRGRLPRFLRTGHHRSPRASALIVSLAFVVLIAILVVGFATTSRLERDIVESHSAKLQAGLLNELAVRVAQARLQSGTTNTANSTWLSQPGRITTISGNTNGFFDLSSGASANVTQDVSVDLNPPPLLNNERAISGNFSVSMPVKWIYVRQDGSLILDPSAAPTYDAGNPIVGRFAFWTDDLSARINLNTATAASATNPPTASWPGRQNLTALTNLTASDIAALKSFRADTNHFETVRDALRANTNSTTLRNTLANQKFDVTHFSHSPASALNVFGEPKIFLTTSSNRAHGSTNYFNILASPTADPGIIANIHTNNYNSLFAKLYGYLSRTNWPLMPGKSFVQKYGAQSAAQIVLNLIDYVRSAEANNVVVEASRGSFNAGNFSWLTGIFGASGMMGNARRLLITQMGVWVSDTAPSTTVRFRTEVFLPPSAGDSTNEVDLWEGNREMFCEIAGGNFSQTASAPRTPVNKRIIKDYGTIEGGTGPQSSRAKMKPGDYRTISMPFDLTTLTSNATRPTGPFYLRATLYNPNSVQYGADIAPQMQAPGNDWGQAQYDIDPPSVAYASISSIAVDDPVINKSRFDWKKTTANTFGSSPSVTSVSTLGGAPSGTPQQDTDGSGQLTGVGFGFPAVKGSSRNPRGMVESLAELGRIHTGGRGTGPFIANAGTPWRTLRIQPRVSSDASLPDWLLLDLFAVPEGASGVTSFDDAIMQPTANTIAGRVNVNARIFPTNWPTTNRTAPLLSVLSANVTAVPLPSGNGTVTPLPNPTGVATNITTGILATGSNPGRWYGNAAFTNEHLFLTPAQIVEIAGVADTGEASEARLAAILPFLTTQSSAFAVFSVGQKIRQLSSGEIRVLGESRSMTILERQGDGQFRQVSTTELGL